MWARKQELHKYQAKKCSRLFFLPVSDEPNMMMNLFRSLKSTQRKLITYKKLVESHLESSITECNYACDQPRPIQRDFFAGLGRDRLMNLSF